MTILAIIGGILLVLIIWAILTYNSLIRSKALLDEALSGVDVQLKRRFELIPNLVATVQGYAGHEKETLEKVIQARSMVQDAGSSVEQRLEAENMLTSALRSLFAVSEAYPDLKANINFQKLHDDLSQLETELQLSRRYYNGAVRSYNIRVESFPSNAVAGYYRFEKAAYFETEEETRQVPTVAF